MPTGYEGWGALGEMLAGNTGTPGVYEDTLKKTYSAEQALHDARLARSKALIGGQMWEQRSRLDDDLTARALAGDQQAQAVLGTIALAGNDSVNLDQLNHLKEMGYRQGAVDSTLGGDPNAANAYLTGLASGPLKINEVTGGVATNPYQVDAPIRLTPLGESEVVADLALADQHRAVGQASLIRANKGPALRQPSAASADAEVLAQARAAIAAGGSVEAVRQRLKDRGYGALAGKL